MAETRWLTRAEAAAHLGLQLATLEKWACRARGPTYYRRGRFVRYRQHDLDAWMMGQAEPEMAAEETALAHAQHQAVPRLSVVLPERGRRS